MSSYGEPTEPNPNSVLRRFVSAASVPLLAGLAITAVYSELTSHSKSDYTSEATNDQHFKQLSQAYSAELGIPKSLRKFYLQLIGLSTSEIEADLHDRTQLLSPSDPTAPDAFAGDFIPINVSHDYSFNPEKKPNKSNDGEAAWTIKSPGSDYGDMLPLARVRLNKAGKLAATDMRPPLERRVSASNAQYHNFVSRLLAPEVGFMKTALKSGVVSQYNFGYSDEFSALEKQFGAESSYNDGKGHVFVVLSKIKPESYRDERGIITHETGHGYFNEDPLSADTKQTDHSPAAQAVQQDCLEIRHFAFSDGASRFLRLVPLIRKFQRVEGGSGQDSQILIDDIKGDFLGTLQYDDSNVAYNQVPDCDYNTGTSWLGYINSEILHPEHFPKLGKQGVNLSMKLDDKAESILRRSPVLDVITEHTYTHQPLEGHPEDGIDELAASLFDISINYPEQFVAKTDALPAAPRHAVANLYANMRKIFVRGNPGLNSVLPHLKFKH